ncbi:CDP-glycerol glycerophosphotransferase family protein [Vibrio sp. E150_018]
MYNKIKKFFKSVIKKENKKAKIIYTIERNKNLTLENVVLFESYHGSQISSNEFYLMKDLYFRGDRSVGIFIACTKSSEGRIKERLSYYGIEDVKLVRIHSKEYCHLLCVAKFLINSTSFPDYFFKREGQIYLNTWHGTPLKNMGRSDVDEPHMITNIQRNFLMSDYILFPNSHTKRVMEKEYMLSNLYKGKFILEGYPRNDVFFSGNKQLKYDLGLSEKKVFVYMPTWRGKLGRNNNMYTLANIYLFIEKLSRSLSDNEVLFVSFHYLMKKGINIGDFKNTFYIPGYVETYDFLNVADVLITDYSSVMFDFINSNKKIALYQFDYDEYDEYRGVTIDNESLPFFKSKNIDEVISFIKDDNVDNIESSLDLRFCEWETAYSSEKVNDFLFYNKENTISFGYPECNNKENILIYPGNLAKNGITTSILSLLGEIDRSRFNVFLTFSQNAVKNNKDIILNLDRDIVYIPFRAMLNYSYMDALFLFLYFNFHFSFLNGIIKNIYSENFKKVYPNCDFSHLIQFSGYDRHVINLFSSSDVTKTIYCHNDMWGEFVTKRNYHKLTMDNAYTSYDNIALVNPVLADCFGKFKVDRSKLTVVENLHPHDLVVHKSSMPIMFDSETKSNISKDELELILNDNSKKKFINIGRFSPEKGHDRLISAFERACAEDDNLYLIIIGGPGRTYNETLKLAKNSEFSDRIVIIHSIRNPFPILKLCDLFLLSSHYEGLGLVMLEAISLGVPVISTDIPAPRAFLEKGYGTIVENSTDGLYQGMNDFLGGSVFSAEVDWDEYNAKALGQFYGLLESK